MIFRKMTKADYKHVYTLWTSCPGIGLNDRDDSKNGIERFLEKNPKTCFVAEDNKKIVGTILAGSDGRRGYIYHTAVEETYQNRGIGKKLVEKALEGLKKEGIVKAALVVFEKNENGNLFWEKEGFTVRNDLIYRNKPLSPIV